MTPVAIGDTQGTLQARKTWFAVYKCPETFLRLHTHLGGLQAHTWGASRHTPGRSPDTHPRGSQHALRQTPPPADGYCCRWYASYWNAFLLPAAMKLWPRLCFYRCLWFCQQGGSASVHAGMPHPQPPPPPPQEQRPTPPQTRQTPRPGRPTHPPGPETHPQTRQNPPGPETRPLDQADPPDQADSPPGSRRQHTVNERPVRILLECILVFMLFLVKIWPNNRLAPPPFWNWHFPSGKSFIRSWWRIQDLEGRGQPSTCSAIHKAAGLTVPGLSMIWLVQILKIHEAVNSGTVSQGSSCQWHFYHSARNAQ